MKKFIYAIKDNKIGSFMDPLFSEHLTPIMRQLSEVSMNEQSMLFKYPQDFELYQLGEYDTSTGEIIKPKTGPSFVMNITEIKREAMLSSGGTNEEKQN